MPDWSTFRTMNPGQRGQSTIAQLIVYDNEEGPNWPTDYKV